MSTLPRSATSPIGITSRYTHTIHVTTPGTPPFPRADPISRPP